MFLLESYSQNDSYYKNNVLTTFYLIFRQIEHIILSILDFFESPFVELFNCEKQSSLGSLELL